MNRDKTWWANNGHLTADHYTIEQLYQLFKERSAIGVPGTGACICKMAPDRERRRLSDGTLIDTLNSVIDHRCPKHGEKAQPALWGRHKELELIVEPKQWDALGVRHE